MKKFILSVVMLTGLATFAQETPKHEKSQVAQPTATAEKPAEKKSAEITQAQPAATENKAATTAKPAEAQPATQAQPADQPKKQK